MSSTLRTALQRHRAVVEAARAPLERTRALADHAVLLARHWRAGEACSMLGQARRAAAEARDDDARVRLALAEAVVAWHSVRRDARAAPLVLESCQHAADHGDTALQAECEAWAGLIVSTSGAADAPAAVPHLRRAVALAAHRHPAPLARALVTLAMLSQRSGAIEAALPLYSQAVQQARRAGDEQLLLEVHRSSTLGQVEDARRLRSKGRLDAALCLEVLAGLAGVESLAQQLAPDDAGAQVPLAQAALYSLMGRDEAALQLHRCHLDSEAAAACGDERLIARCDEAWCLARSGLEAEGRERLDALRPLQPQRPTAYARAAMADSLAAAALQVGDQPLRRDLETAAFTAWSEVELQRAELRTALA